VTRPKTSHPGELLREEFLAPLNLSANALALALRVPSTRICEIVNPDLWMNLQVGYELRLVQDTSFKQIRKEVKPRKTQAPHPEND
jgi:plasmid maintenance system antidote protein VapI